MLTCPFFSSAAGLTVEAAARTIVTPGASSTPAAAGDCLACIPELLGRGVPHPSGSGSACGLGLVPGGCLPTAAPPSRWGLLPGASAAAACRLATRQGAWAGFGPGVVAADPAGDRGWRADQPWWPWAAGGRPGPCRPAAALPDRSGQDQGGRPAGGLHCAARPAGRLDRRRGLRTRP